MNRYQLNEIISDINVVGIIQDYMSGESLVPKLNAGESPGVVDVVKEKLWRLGVLRKIDSSLAEYYSQIEDLPGKYTRGDIWR